MGLFITTGLTLVIANFLDLSSISVMGSSGFLIIFAIVNLANYRLAKQTHSIRYLSLTGTILCGLALLAIVWQTLNDAPGNLIVLLVMVLLAFGAEYFYQSLAKRRKSGESA